MAKAGIRTADAYYLFKRDYDMHQRDFSEKFIQVRGHGDAGGLHACVIRIRALTKFISSNYKNAIRNQKFPQQINACTSSIYEYVRKHILA